MFHICSAASFTTFSAACRKLVCCVIKESKAAIKVGGVCVALKSICFCSVIRCICILINSCNAMLIDSISFGFLKRKASFCIICPFLSMPVSISTWRDNMIHDVAQGSELLGNRTLSSSVKFHSLALIAHSIISLILRSLCSLVNLLTSINANTARPIVPAATNPLITKAIIEVI